MAKVVQLTKKQIEKAQAPLSNDWKLVAKDTKLVRQFVFANAVEALSFIAKIIVHAEVLQHHPDIEFSYNKIKCTLTTHDFKCLTKLDFALADRIDALYTEYEAKQS